MLLSARAWPDDAAGGLFGFAEVLALAVLGLLAGILGVAVWYVLDDSVLLSSDVEKRCAIPVLGYRTAKDGAEEIARRSRGTPRIANRLLRRVRDFAQVDGLEEIQKPIADKALEMLEIDHLGLDRIDRTLLTAMITKYGGGPVGLDTLAATTGEDSGTIEDVYEPYLLQMGLLQRTPRGRIVTPGAYEHLGLPAPERKKVQDDLFG